MDCLSIWDPWATLIAIGAKSYETRSWLPPDRILSQRLAIHAAKSTAGLRLLAQDKELQLLTWSAMHAAGRDTSPQCWHPGCILAIATVAFAIRTDGPIGREILPTERALGDWSPGRFAWRLTDVVTLTNPIPATGRQGVFTLPPPVLEKIQQQIVGAPC